MANEPLPLKPFITGVPEETLGIPVERELRTIKINAFFGGGNTAIPSAAGKRIKIFSMQFNVSGSVSLDVVESDTGAGELFVLENITASNREEFIVPYITLEGASIIAGASGGGNTDIVSYFEYI